MRDQHRRQQSSRSCETERDEWSVFVSVGDICSTHMGNENLVSHVDFSRLNLEVIFPRLPYMSVETCLYDRVCDRAANGEKRRSSIGTRRESLSYYNIF